MFDPGTNFFDWVVTAGGTIVAWFVKSTRADNKEHAVKISQLELQQAQLIGRVEFHAEMSEIRKELSESRKETNRNFDKVFDKLDKKADK